MHLSDVGDQHTSLIPVEFGKLLSTARASAGQSGREGEQKAIFFVQVEVANVVKLVHKLYLGDGLLRH